MRRTGSALRAALVAVLSVLLIAPGTGIRAPAARASTVGANGTVVFTRVLAHGGRDIWEVGLGGRHIRNVTGHNSSDESQATWSPEGGAHIAFVMSKRARGARRPGDIWWMTPRGRKRFRLTSTPKKDERHPAWAPGGGRLVFSRARFGRRRDGPADLVVMTLHATRADRRTHTKRVDEIEPAWSPDGQFIAFSSDRDGAYGIYRMTDLGENVRKLARHARTPSWSPTSRQIVFQRRGDIWIMNRSGGHERRLTSGGFRDVNPNFTPDNTRIVFQRGRALYTMDRHGGDVRRIDTGGRPAVDPDLRPRCEINGTARHDVLRGTNASDLICYSGGGDVMYGRGGSDFIFGGTGHDVIFAGSGNDFVNSGGRRAFVGDVVHGGPGNDFIPASLRSDRIDGGPGADHLDGEAGNDRIDARDGVRGNDYIDGGLGYDVCIGDKRDHFFRCEVVRKG